MRKLYFIVTLCFVAAISGFAQPGGLKGTVTTADGRAAVNVSISVKGTRLGAVSNTEGNYLIEKVEPGNYQVKVTLVGLQAVEKEIEIDGGITFKSDKISYNLLVNNILNKYLYSGAPYTYGGYYYWQTEAGTNFRLSVGYKF